jgi:hypothetical protein
MYEEKFSKFFSVTSTGRRLVKVIFYAGKSVCGWELCISSSFIKKCMKKNLVNFFLSPRPGGGL